MKLTNMMTLNTAAVTATAVAKEGADMIATGMTSASATYESDTSSSSASFENDDDDCYFVMDGNTTTNHASDDSYSPSVIHYMGHEFPAEQFQHTAQVMEESRRSSVNASASMGLQDHEQLSDRWSALSAVTDMLSASQRGISSSLSMSKHNSCHTTRRLTIAAAPTASSLLSRSEHVLLSSTASRRATTGSSRASFVQKVLEFGSQHGNSNNNNNTSYNHYNLDDRTNRHLQKWGISHGDVMDIIQEDTSAFAKLQQDLRKRNAITNLLIEQRMYIFVHNTKTRNLRKQKEQQKEEEEEEEDKEEQKEEPVEVEETEPQQEQEQCDC